MRIPFWIITPTRIFTFLKGQRMNIAILIDAENIDPVYAEQIFACAESKGTIVTKEIYGAGIALNEWSVPILRYALHTNMTLKPNRFKNCSDIALVIGAMDLLVERAARGAATESNTTADAVVIASSDSDYSALALRLRTSGIQVIGMGEDARTNPSWPVACSEFIFFTPVDETRQADQPKPRAIPSIRKADHQTAAHGKPHGAGRGPEHPKHIDRVAYIRKFISDQLSKNNGQMASAALFNLLNELPDYQYDQQRSKRTPLDYLSRQYGDLLKIQKTPDGVLWAYSKLADAAGDAETEHESAAPQASAPEQAVPPDTESTSPSLDEFLRGAGIDEADAQKVLSAYEGCSNMREVYNVLRKTFKTKTGTAYYKLVKQYKGSRT